MITNSSTSKKQSWTSLQCIPLAQNNQNVQVMPHSTCLPAFCEKTAEPVWLPRKLKLGLGQMFLNGNIYHTFQNREQTFHKYIILQKRELPYIFVFIFLFEQKILFRTTICLERTSSGGSFLSYKGHWTKSGEKVKIYLLIFPERVTLENKHWKSLLVDFVKSHWKEEYKKYLFVKTEYARGGKILS